MKNPIIFEYEKYTTMRAASQQNEHPLLNKTIREQYTSLLFDEELRCKMESISCSKVFSNCSGRECLQEFAYFSCLLNCRNTLRNEQISLK